MPKVAVANRKQQLLEVATGLFSQKGYHATSMRDIAEAAGIEAASIYNHFNGKEEILHEICFDLANKFIHAIAEVNDIYFDAEKKLQMAVKNHIAILTVNLPASRVFIHEWRNLGEEPRKQFIQLRDQYEDGFKDILKTGEEENVFKSGDRKFAALTILSSLNWITEWYKSAGSMSPEQIAENLTHFILTGLRKEKPF